MKNIWSLFLAVGFLFLALGCSQIQDALDKASKPKTLTCKNGNCEITVPGTWRADDDLNAEATLGASNRLAELYVVVIDENKQDTGDIGVDAAADFIRESTREWIPGGVYSETVPVIVNGYPARRFEIAGTVENINVKYIYTVVDAPTSYYQVLTWTLASRFERNKNKMIEVADSFKETAVAPQPAATLSLPVQMPAKKK